MRTTTRRLSAISLSLLLVAFAIGCGGSGSDADAGKNQATPTPQLTDEERILKSLQTANFKEIFVIKRKDGEEFSSDDKKLIRKVTYRANRRRMTKDSKTILIGTNYKLDEIDKLKKEFEFKDHSPIIQESNSNANTNKEK